MFDREEQLEGAGRTRTRSYTSIDPMSILRVLDGIAIDIDAGVCVAIEFFFTDDLRFCDDAKSEEPSESPRSKTDLF